MRYLISTLLTILVVVSYNPDLGGQDIVPFKDQMTTKKYEELSQLELEAKEEKDPYQRAIKYRNLGEDGTRLSNALGEILFSKAMIAALDSKNDSMIAVVHIRGSIPLLNTARYEEARLRLDKALQNLLSSTNTLELARCYTVIGYLERLEGNNYLAISNLFKAKELEEKVMPLYEMWDVTNRLMINYNQIGDPETAITLGEELIASAQHLDEKPRGYHTILRNTGDMLLEQGELETAKKYIEESAPVWMKGRIPKFMAHTFSLLYDLAIAEDSLQLAKMYADSNLIYCNQYGSLGMLSDAHLKLYRVLDRLNKPAQLEYHLDMAMSKAHESQLMTAILSASQEASIYAAHQKKYKKAYQLLNLADSLNKELYSEEKANNLRKFEKQLIQDESQEEINLLSIQNELKTENLEKAVKLRRSLIGFLALAIGSLFLTYLLFRERSKNNEILQEKNKTISKALSEKETLLREIHHRVKNNLQFISSLLGLQTDHVDDPSALGALQEGQDRVQSMALIHQNLYQEDNLTGVDVKGYLFKLIQGLFDSYNIHEENVRLLLEVDEINLDVDTVIPIGLIVNELITNSLKYAFPDDQKGTISIKMYQKENNLILSVSDNGVGMTSDQKEKIGDSFGYKLIDAFARQLEAQMTIDVNDGTTVNFVISDYQVAI